MVVEIKNDGCSQSLRVIRVFDLNESETSCIHSAEISHSIGLHNVFIA